MDEVTGVRGEDLKCSKHLDILPQCKQESRVMRGFPMSHEEPYSMCPGSPNLDTLFLENMLSLPLKHHPTLCGFFFFLHSVLWFNLLGDYLFPPFLFTNRQFILILFPVHLPLTRGQVCPCVASSNRKCIMDVTFLSISTTKSHSPLCSE